MNFRLCAATVWLFAGLALCDDQIHWNGLGYEATGPKTIVIRNTSGTVAATGFEIRNAAGATVYSGSASAEMKVEGWGNTAYKNCDFSALQDTGYFTLKSLPTGQVTALAFHIGQEQVLKASLDSILLFFNGMRSTYAKDKARSYYGQSWRGTHDVSGGWQDASSDGGKYISHLSYANTMNPQQIPLVVWSLLRTGELAPKAAAGSMAAIRSEAAWGADYLLRILDPGGYFYINVFSPFWGSWDDMVICAWSAVPNANNTGWSNGTPNSEYQSALREGGGMSIAALALAARLGISGDSSSAQYLSGAQRAFDSLTSQKGRWADDGRENLIDHYCALVAAVELARATHQSRYYDSAAGRADSIVGRQTPEGWFVSDNGSRPFYHAVDEGLPLVALWTYLQIDSTSARATRVRTCLKKSIRWYRNLTRKVTNPFLYPRMYAKAYSSGKLAERFFMPQDNETHYWWQGENARLGSMTAGLLLAGRGADPKWNLSPSDSLSQEGMAGIDWVQGKNSEGINFLYKVGLGNYADYGAPGRNRIGGICNGITARSDDDPSPLFENTTGDYGLWRWLEQWIPHDAWFLLGAASVAHLVESNSSTASVHPAVVQAYPFAVTVNSGRIQVQTTGSADWCLRDLAGRTLARAHGPSAEWKVTSGSWIVEATSPTGRQSQVVTVP